MLVCAAALAAVEGAPIERAEQHEGAGDVDDHRGEVGNQPMHSADQMSKLLRIKDAVEALSTPVPLGGDAPKGVQSLGESTPEEKRRAQLRKARPGVDSDLIRLDHLLDRFEEVGQSMDTDQASQSLGEANVAAAKLVQSDVLHKLMNIQGDRDSAKAVQRVANFLTKQLRKGVALTRAELDEVRQFYIDQTANVLARYGYEDSPYGKHDVSARRGDAVAARQHMDEVDERLHMSAQESPGMKPKGVQRVLHYMKETARLSDFLSRLAHVSTESAAIKHTLHGSRMDNLARLQADEEAITDGIEQLLHKIKQGSPLKKGDVESMTSNAHKMDRKDKSSKGLAKRAAAESVRLKKLQAELAKADTPAAKKLAKKKVAKAKANQWNEDEESKRRKKLKAELAAAKTPAAKKLAKKKVDDAKADAIRHGSVSAPAEHIAIPLPKLKDELNGFITEELDDTLHRFHEMQSKGRAISPKIKREINKYLRLITAHLLKTYLTYDEWTDKTAILKEASAVKAGDADAPSRIQVGHPMSSKRVVEHFLADTWHHPAVQPVPLSVQQILQHGAMLPSGARVTIITSVNHGH